MRGLRGGQRRKVRGGKRRKLREGRREGERGVFWWYKKEVRYLVPPGVMKAPTFNMIDRTGLSQFIVASQARKKKSLRMWPHVVHMARHEK